MRRAVGAPGGGASRSRGLAAVALCLLALGPGAAPSRAARRGSAVAAPASTAPRTMTAAALAQASADAYMPLARAPAAQTATAFGGVLAGAYAVSYEDAFESPTLPAVVDDHGDAWLVAAGAGAGKAQRLEQVSPAGAVLWSTPLPATVGLVAGNGDVLVLEGGDGRYALFDVATRTTTTISPPYLQPAQDGTLNIKTTVGVVGSVVVLATSQYTANGEGVATQAGVVQVYRADGALLRAFSLPHRRIAAQPGYPNDSCRIASLGPVAYLAWNDLPSGSQAGVYEITAAGQVFGSFAVAAAFSAGTASQIAAVPGGRLLVRNAQTGWAELVAVAPRGLRTLWRRRLAGGAMLFAGRVVLTAGAALRLYRLDTGALAARSAAGPGYVLQPVVAGPFGVVAEAKSPTRPPALLLIDPAGAVAWRVALRSGRMFPLATTVGGDPAIYLGPNLPVLVWR